MEDKKDKNWLTKQGYSDSDFVKAGAPREVMYQDGFNRAMLDTVHAQNVSDYISSGMNESEAKFKADQQRSMAIKAAKANGLSMT